MSVWLKLEKVQWAAPWIRVDGPVACRVMSFDNRCTDLLGGTAGWTRYELVVDVPLESLYIAFGVMLGGSGTIWIDDIAFESVGRDLPTTDCPCSPRYKALTRPQNLDFEDG